MAHFGGLVYAEEGQLARATGAPRVLENTVGVVRKRLIIEFVSRAGAGWLGFAGSLGCCRSSLPVWAGWRKSSERGT